MNVDYKLDLYNSIIEFSDKAPESNSLLSLIYDSDNNDLMLFLRGDINKLGNAILGDWKNGNNGELETIKKFMLNVTYSILLEDKEKRDLMINALKDI